MVIILWEANLFKGEFQTHLLILLTLKDVTLNVTFALCSCLFTLLM